MITSNKLVRIAEDAVRGGLFLLTGNALSTVISAVGSIIIARLLGPENYGVYSISLVIPSLLIGFIGFGLDAALVRYSARLRAESRNELVASVLRTGLLFKFLIGASMSFFCLTFSDSLAAFIVNRPELGFYIRLASPLILFQSLLATVSSAFIGLDRMENNALLMNLQSIMKTFLAPLLILLGFSVLGAITGHVLSYAVASIAGIFILLKLYKSLDSLSSLSFSDNLRAMLRYGLPLYFSALLMLLSSQYRVIILSYFTSNTEIGNFQAATTLSTIIVILAFPFTTLFPAFAKVDPNGEDLKRLFRLSVKYTALLIVPTSIAMAIIAEDIVYVLYGHAYSLAPTYLSIYILIYIYAGLGSIVLEHMLRGIGETRIVFKYNLINTSSLIPLATVLTMLYGVLGLIASILISGLISLIYGLLITVKRVGVSLDISSSLRIYLASAVSAIPLTLFIHLSPLHSIPNIALGSLVFFITYLTILPLINGIQTQDLEILKLLFSKIKILWPLIKPILLYEYKILNLRTRTKT
ncbi:MAG: flippase [Sulfolobales archaeon]